jgi:hypothetical protein
MYLDLENIFVCPANKDEGQRCFEQCKERVAKKWKPYMFTSFVIQTQSSNFMRHFLQSHRTCSWVLVTSASYLVIPDSNNDWIPFLVVYLSPSREVSIKTQVLCVFYSLSFAVIQTFNAVWSWSSWRFLCYRVQVLSEWQFLSKWTILESEYESYNTTDGESASLSWNKAPIWGIFDPASIDFLISLLHGPSRKRRFRHCLYCWMRIRCRGNVYIEPLPRKGSTI